MARQTVVDQGVRDLEALIESLEVGSATPSQREIARLFGMSRSSVREAVQLLLARGLIEVIPGRGTYKREAVVPDTTQLAQAWETRFHQSPSELIEARLTIEAAAAEMAAQRASAADIEAMAEAHRAMQAAATANDLGGLVHADLSFHAAIIKGSENRVFEAMLRVVEPLLIDSRRASLGYAGRPGKVLVKHGAILEAIRRSDGPGARAAMTDHLQDASRDMGFIRDDRRQATTGSRSGRATDGLWATGQSERGGASDH